jgi:hypothetical protein
MGRTQMPRCRCAWQFEPWQFEHKTGRRRPDLSKLGFEVPGWSFPALLMVLIAFKFLRVFAQLDHKQECVCLLLQ